MIERVIAWSVRNRFLVLVLVAAFAVLGVFALRKTPIDAIPDLSENQVIVFADWAGRSPREVEDQVTRPLSLHLEGLARVKSVRGSSEAGFSMIDVIFEDDVDFYFARTRVQERLATAGSSLPARVTPYMAPDATALGQILWYTVEGEGRDLGELRAIEDFYVRPRLASVPGVAQVASIGGKVREWQVEIDPDRLAGLGLTLGEVSSAVSRSNDAVGAGTISKSNAEYIVRGIGWVKDGRDLEDAVVAARDGVPVRVRDVARVELGPAPRRGVLERDGREAVGGVVLMRFGENPRSVTAAVHEKLDALAPGLPEGVRVVPFYERTRLIDDAISTVATTVLVEIAIACAVIFLVMRHLGASLVVCLTLPLAILGSFIGMRCLGVTSNIMSLSGIAISVGVLVDQAIVLADNAMHRLRERFGDGEVEGDTRELLVGPCQEVGRPVFFAILVMLVSFLPVFALSGMEGKMFHPLAWTKTLALLSVGVLTITLLPALLPVVLRGRIRSEEESWLVRSVAAVYRPVLSWLMDRPKLVLGSFVAILAVGIVLAGRMGSEFMPPLDEGSILDMPVTVPRVSVAQAADDLAARDALLREFPEVASVVGKAGRAETPTDPSPLSMIETMVDLRPKEEWPYRHLDYDDALAESRAVLDLLVARGVVKACPDEERAAVANDGTMFAVESFDAAMRAFCLRRRAAWGRELAPLSADGRAASLAKKTVELRWELDALAPATYADAAVTGFARTARDRGVLLREAEADDVAEVRRSREGAFRPYLRQNTKRDLLQEMDAYVRVPGWANIWTQPIVNRIDMLATGVRTTVGVKVFGPDEATIRRVADEVAGILRAVPGAVDVAPDQSAGASYVEVRVDRQRAARSGANAADVLDVVETALGGKVVSQTLDAGERTAVRVRCSRAARADEAALRRILVPTAGRTAESPAAMSGPAAGMAMGAAPADVVTADPMGGMSGGTPASAPRPAAVATVAGSWSPDPGRAGQGSVPLSAVADVRIVEGPTMIRSENGSLCGYVQMNVRDRDLAGFVEEAPRVVAERVATPPGVALEWSGQFEHEVHVRRTLAVVFPVVVALIFLILWWTWRDSAHAALLMLAVPGALAGGVIVQALFGHPFSTAAWIGYAACFGMATQTGIVMLVYLRKAAAEAGALDGLRDVVLSGAVRRLRPKLLTEAVTVLAIAPMLSAVGTGAEVMRPMAAPVLGGILVADEVIDVVLPVLFYALEERRRVSAKALSVGDVPSRVW
jgi:Cu(I)/Ag(I) efflux system membrane protein CusA/SilA